MALVPKLDHWSKLSAATIALLYSTTAATETTVPMPVCSSLRISSDARGSVVDPGDTRAKEEIDIIEEVAKLRCKQLLLA